MRRWLWLAATGILALLVLLGVASWRSGGSDDLKERLAPCPRAGNCVSSLDRRESRRIEPLAAEGDPAELFRRAVEAVRALPRTRIVTAEEGYLHAECRSALFRFVDDLELQLDSDSGVVHVRSAARVGRSDLGVNRRRVEALRAALK